MYFEREYLFLWDKMMVTETRAAVSVIFLSTSSFTKGRIYALCVRYCGLTLVYGVRSRRVLRGVAYVRSEYLDMAASIRQFLVGRVCRLGGRA